jgi:hypothetical protein
LRSVESVSQKFPIFRWHVRRRHGFMRFAGIAGPVPGY